MWQTQKSNSTEDKTRSDLELKSDYELRALAKQSGIQKFSKLKRQELIDRLLCYRNKVEAVLYPHGSYWQRHNAWIWGVAGILATILVGWIFSPYFWHSEALEDRLQREYPLGYILCDVGGPGKQLKNMRFHPDEAVMQADWQDTTAEVDTTKKFARLTIHNPSWKRKTTSAQAVVNGNAVWEGEYTLRTPVEVNFAIRVEGAPRMFLEIIDDSGSVVQCVIGLK